MSNPHFQKVRNYLQDLGYDASNANVEAHTVLVTDENKGLNNLIVDCEDNLLVIEQYICNVSKSDTNALLRLLQMNRTLIHGAFVINEEATRIIFRDTLQLENLDLNELDASLNALSLALAENAGELLAFSKN